MGIRLNSVRLIFRVKNVGLFPMVYVIDCLSLLSKQDMQMRRASGTPTSALSLPVQGLPTRP